MSKRRLALAAAAAVTAALTVPVAAQAAEAGPAASRPHDDFNGDGYPDLAIGAPPKTSAGTKPGSVTVLYGSANGLSTSRRQVLDDSKVYDESHPTGYGTDLQSADLDGDGYADLLSFIQWAPVDGDRGNTVTVNWGGPKGLSADRDNLVRLPDSVWTYGFTVGDVDGDKHPDVITLGNEYGVEDGYGDVLHGPFDRSGNPARTSTFTIDTDNFQIARTIAAGDVNGDGIADLAVGAVDSEEPDSRKTALLLGSSRGLAAPIWLKDPNGRRMGGEDLAIGDLNKDGYAEIVIGHSMDVYDSDVELPTKGGALGVVYGGPNGVSTTRKPVWINQDTAGVPGAGERGDGMGTGLSIGDTDGDGYQDVATGLPGEDLGTLADAGSVLVLRGGAHGLTGTGAKTFHQNTTGVPGTAEKNDRFGTATTLVDADGDHKYGLVVGDPAENANNGSVWVFAATSGGITASRSFTFGAATVGVTPTGARFGTSLGD
ncbi:VCBS repeat-containing protein [Streptomyces aquilus]|uniref:VCBS repeat-containing protein n=1 Tax=Streptomyces aquilus TaxID=2548456 RepID=A0A3S9I018_9ACTN|nr:FG-GAP-like repeat-containing protein [Streptomyces aquilus]AZP17669.1 VCBS repeat-containing protein [Streptomyces aquilus]